MGFSQEDLIEYMTGTLNVDMNGVAPDTPLFSSGRIDSFSMIDLIAHLETSYAITIQPSEITLDNLDTLDRITGFVAGKAG